MSKKKNDKGKKILLVEDEPSLLNALVRVFEKEGFEMIVARDGKEGLAKTKKELPDLVLLDIIMPKLDGITMLKQLRNFSWGKGMPVIILTNLSDDKMVEEALMNGVHDYLIKSNWSLKDLVYRVKEKLELL